MNMVNAREHQRTEKAIINALLKISEIVKKSAAGRLSESGRPSMPNSTSTIGGGDIQQQQASAEHVLSHPTYNQRDNPRASVFRQSSTGPLNCNRAPMKPDQSWTERRSSEFLGEYLSALRTFLVVGEPAARPVCRKRKSSVDRRTCEPSRKRRCYDASSTSSNEHEPCLGHMCRNRRHTKRRVTCRYRTSKPDQYRDSRCWNRVIARGSRPSRLTTPISFCASSLSETFFCLIRLRMKRVCSNECVSFIFCLHKKSMKEQKLIYYE